MKIQDKIGKAAKTIYEKLKGKTYGLYTSTQQSIGLTPEISFEEMWKVYLAQPAVKAAVDFRADQVVGAGFFTTMNENYSERRSGKTAKEFIDEFCEHIGLDQLLQTAARNIAAFGNEFWWIKPEEEKAVSIPLFKVQKISFKEGAPATLQLSWDVKPRQIGMEEIVWMKTPPYDKNGFGTGIMQTLCRSLKLGEENVPQTDIVMLNVHLGCTREVSSFECQIQNFDGKYGPNGAYPITLGLDGSISIGRGANCPLIATVRVEEIVHKLSPSEAYLIVRGRCWGERLFRRTVTKKWENKKGEEIVTELIDYYVGLSHTRNGTELIEATDTTYTKLQYEDTPVFDIIRFIAETADKAGVIGYDFRVEPDGKFAFFPKMSKINPIDLTDQIEIVEYRKDIHGIRNKITVYGAAERAKPTDKDAWTETLDINGDNVNDWVSGTSTGVVTLDNGTKIVGNYSVKHENFSSDSYGSLNLYLADNIMNCNKYPRLYFQIRKQKSFGNTVHIGLHDAFGNWADYWTDVLSDEQWHMIEIDVGEKNEDNWQRPSSFDWSQINQIAIECFFDGTGTGSFWIDNLFFNNCRWEATEEDTQSQTSYGLRELVEIDEELHSDYECQLRAKALLDYLKDPIEYLKVRSTVIDYGNNPILPGDKVHIILPSLNIDADYRVATIEYRVDARTQTLEVSMELGREPQLLADYLYALRSKTAKLSKTKAYR